MTFFVLYCIVNLFSVGNKNFSDTYIYIYINTNAGNQIRLNTRL